MGQKGLVYKSQQGKKIIAVKSSRKQGHNNSSKGEHDLKKWWKKATVYAEEDIRLL